MGTKNEEKKNTYVARETSSTSVGELVDAVTWKVTTELLERRKENIEDEWEVAKMSVVIYAKTFEEAHQQSTVHIFQQLIELGGGEVTSLFDLQSATEDTSVILQ